MAYDITSSYYEHGTQSHIMDQIRDDLRGQADSRGGIKGQIKYSLYRHGSDDYSGCGFANVNNKSESIGSNLARYTGPRPSGFERV